MVAASCLHSPELTTPNDHLSIDERERIKEKMKLKYALLSDRMRAQLSRDLDAAPTPEPPPKKRASRASAVRIDCSPSRILNVNSSAG